MSAMLNGDTLERLVPTDMAPEDATGLETFKLHAERYRFAAKYCRPGRLIDIACGAGYGTRIMVEERADIEEALGMDISEAAIAYARENYHHPRTSYAAGDAMTFRAKTPYDTAVSLETVEHLPDPAAFIENLLRSLTPDARFIASVPTTPSVDVNPHHLHDFTEDSFRKLCMSLGLREIGSFRQVQSFNPLRVLSRREKRLADMRPNLLRYYLGHPSAALKRAFSTFRDGFNNCYITIAWEKTWPDVQRSPHV